MPFTYVLVSDYTVLILRFFHDFATAIYGTVAMVIIMDISGEKKGQLVGTYGSAGLIGGLIAAPLSGWLLNYLGDGAPVSPSISPCTS
jgi:DHA1 family multidrug resistance protein-like MFS transporter